jgi:ribosomal protein S18 acetylase RimI-like enzyme
MVDSDNDYAISIYEYLGFYSLGDMDFISENIDRIFMRKDLLFDCE